MNSTKYVAAIFGLKLNEEFKIITNNNNSLGRFRFTENNDTSFLEQYSPYDRKWHDTYLEYLEMLVMGKCKNERLRKSNDI